MINKLISKSQVRVLNCDNCMGVDYVRGYARAISDVLDLATIPTLGADALEKIRAEIEQKINENISMVDGTPNEYAYCYSDALAIIDKHIEGKDK